MISRFLVRSLTYKTQNPYIQKSKQKTTENGISIKLGPGFKHDKINITTLTKSDL